MAYYNQTLMVPIAYGATGYSTAVGLASLPGGKQMRSGGVTPGFRNLRVSGGELPDLPLDHIVCRAKYPMQVCEGYSAAKPALRLSNYGNWAVKPFLIPLLPTDTHLLLYDKCLGKLPERLNGPQFSVPLFARDFKQTTRMFTTAVKRVWQTFKTRRRDFVVNRKSTANGWLEYRMGWRLAIMDLYDAMAVLTDHQRSGYIMRVKVTSSAERIQTAYTSGSYSGFMIAPGDYVADVNDVQNWKEMCTLSLRMRDTSFLGLGTLQQLGFTNPASFIWDAVPLSFILDWLTSIGDYLRTLDIFVGREFVSGTVSFSTQIDRVVTPVNVRGTNTWVPSYWLAPSNSYNERYYKRTVLLKFPKASLPHIQVSLNPQRVLDSLALLSQFKK